HPLALDAEWIFREMLLATPSRAAESIRGHCRPLRGIARLRTRLFTPRLLTSESAPSGASDQRGSVQGLLLVLISRGSNRSLERVTHLCANLSCFLCGGLQLRLKEFDLNAEGLLKILGAQKLLAEVSVGCNLPLNVCLEGAYLLLIGAWKASH